MACPLDCEFLRDARKHDKPPEIEMTQVPNQDIRVTEEFLEENEPLLGFLGQTVAAAALGNPGTVDFDVREALEALIRTYRTLQSGVYYESLPNNPLAAGVYSAVQSATTEFREQERQRLGMSKTRDADILGLLVFLQRVEFDRNNGRKRGRAFADFLQIFYSDSTAPAPRGLSSIILP